MAYWKAIARSYPGTNHMRTGKPCQDYVAYEMLSRGLLIGAVADGAEHAPHSHIGAELAVENVIFYLRKALQSGLIAPPSTEQEALTWFGNLSDLVQTDLRKLAEINQADVQELDCTLLAFIATPHHMVAMQIGEGYLVIRPCSSPEYRLVFKPGLEKFNGQPTFVTCPSAQQKMQVRVLHEPASFICVATKGIASVALRKPELTPHVPFFQPLERYLAATFDPELIPQYLEAFLTSDKVNQRISEDRTLFLAQLTLENSNHSIFFSQHQRDMNRLNGKHFYN